MLITIMVRIGRPVKGELALGAEEVDVVLELELENADI